MGFRLSENCVESMVSYKTIMSPQALRMLESYADYIENEFESPETADALYEDAERTLENLSRVAESLMPLSDKMLAEMGYRKILFNRMDYLFIYRVEGDTAYVGAVYHQKQDYENLFAEQVGIK